MYQVPPAYSAPMMAPQRMSLSQLLDESFKLYRRHFSTFAAIAFLMALPGLFLTLIMTVTVMPDFLAQMEELNRLAEGGRIDDPSDLGRLFQPLLSFMAVMFGIVMIEVLVFRQLAEAASAIAVRDAYAQYTSPSAALGAAARRLVSLILWALLLLTLIFVPMVLLIAAIGALVVAADSSGSGAGLLLFCCFLPLAPIFMIYLSIRLIFGSRAIALEDKGVIDAWRRSWQLTSGSFWRVLGIAAVFGILVGILAAILGFVINLLPSLVIQDVIAQQVVSAFGNTIAGALLAPIGYIGLTLLYYDQRRKQEWAPPPPPPVPGMMQGHM